MKYSTNFLPALSLFVLSMTMASNVAFGQPFGIGVSHVQAEQVLNGTYDVNDFLQAAPIDDVDEIICAIKEQVSTDSLHNYIERMQGFYNRNTYADTVSLTTGIGAARRWVFDFFETVSSQNENRLQPAYLDFELPASGLCGPGLFRNTFAILPGTEGTSKGVLIIEGHIDSRCEDVCDITCFAPGAEDNGSGSALVMELARVMSQFSFKSSIVFMLTVGEEQGLYGAEAFSQYCVDNDIDLVSVQNNDVSGGVECGPSSSAPSCAFEGHIDSTALRIFSSGTLNSKHKDYARFVKTVYTEKLLPIVDVSMDIQLMAQEDRSGRGGDHIPFRQDGFRAVRFTAANEHGDANPVGDYTGRQHSVRDVLGKDVDGDGSIDSFYVDFNYLRRNAVINGASMAVAASGPPQVDFLLTEDASQARIDIIDPNDFGHYRIGVRTLAQDFDALYTLIGDTAFSLPTLENGKYYHISVAPVDANNVMGLYSPEANFISEVATPASGDTVQYFPFCNATALEDAFLVIGALAISATVYPNPVDNTASEESVLLVSSAEHSVLTNYTLVVTATTGQLLSTQRVDIHPGENRFPIQADQLTPGLYLIGLQKEGELLLNRKLVVTD